MREVQWCNPVKFCKQFLDRDSSSSLEQSAIPVKDCILLPLKFIIHDL